MKSTINLDKLLGILRLTRINETIPISVLLTYLGLIPLMSFLDLDHERVSILLIANIMAVVATFMINDIEDSIADGEDRMKEYKNPITSKTISNKTGYIATAAVMVLALITYSNLNTQTLLFGISLMTVGFLYAFRKIRLRNRPPMDMLAHLYGAVITLTAFAAFEYYGSLMVFPMLIAVVNSLVVQFGNQTRDYKSDRKAGERTSVRVIGLEKSRLVYKTLLTINAILVIAFVFKYWEVFIEHRYTAILALLIVLAMYLPRVVLRAQNNKQIDKL